MLHRDQGIYNASCEHNDVTEFPVSYSDKFSTPGQMIGWRTTLMSVRAIHSLLWTRAISLFRTKKMCCTNSPADGYCLLHSITSVLKHDLLEINWCDFRMLSQVIRTEVTINLQNSFQSFIHYIIYKYRGLHRTSTCHNGTCWCTNSPPGLLQRSNRMRTGKSVSIWSRGPLWWYCAIFLNKTIMIIEISFWLGGFDAECQWPY